MSWFFNVVMLCLHNKNNILKPAFLAGKTSKSIDALVMQKFYPFFREMVNYKFLMI